MIGKSFKNSSGMALLETLFYVFFLGLLSIVVINSILVMTKSFKETRRQTEIIETSHIMERISREIKQSYDISSISSGNLTLNTRDDAGTAKTINFILSGTDVRLTDNGSFVGNLNLPTIQVSNLSFTEITTSRGKAIKVSFSATSSRDPLLRAYDFYNTIILRGTY
jgi:hypothetical protein